MQIAQVIGARGGGAKYFGGAALETTWDGAIDNLEASRRGLDDVSPLTADCLRLSAGLNRYVAQRARSATWIPEFTAADVLATARGRRERSGWASLPRKLRQKYERGPLAARARR